MDSLAFLQSRLKWATDWLEKSRGESGQDAEKRALHLTQLRDGYSQAVEELRNLRARTKPMPRKLGDLSDLPPELLSEINAVRSDSLEDQLVTVINSYGGTADLDQILVGLYRKFDVVQTRRFIQNKLWRMIQKGFMRSIPNKKGVYTTCELEEEMPVSSERQSFEDDFDDLDDESPF